MNRKINKITTWLAAAIFLFALAINVKVTLDDPFMMLSEEALAQTSGTSTETSTSTSTSSAGVWRKIVTECTAKKRTYTCCPVIFKIEEVPGHTLSCIKDGGEIRCEPHDCIQGATCTQQ